MPKAWLLLLAMAVGTVATVATAQVIAAPSPGDQPLEAATTAPAGDLLTVLLGLACLGVILWRRWDRLPATSRTPALFPPLPAAGIFFGSIVLGLAGTSLAMRSMGLDGPPDATTNSLEPHLRLAAARYGAEAIVIILLLWRWVMVRRRRAASPMPFFRAAAAGGLALLLVWPVMGLAGLVARWITGGGLETIAHDTLRVLTESPRDEWFAGMAALVIVAAPVTEEVLYRGLLQPAFRRLGAGTWPAIALTSLLFAIMHIGPAAPHALASLFVLSLAFGWAYEKTGRLLVPIAMHMLFNAGNLTVALLLTG